MKKNLLIAAIAITALASCTSNDFVGDTGPQGSNDTNGAISFNYQLQNVTRGTSDDATTLSNQFIVWGEKNEAQDEAGAAPTDGNLVFKNYLVKYTASTANQTTSNTNNWEYVGISATSNENTNISPNSGTGAQTIKYWDNAANSYTFTAISALPTDISTGRVSITKTQTGSNVYNKGYSITLAKDGSNNYPSLTNLYFADRINMAPGTNPVTFNFRNVLSHVRVGMYETIPGYEVSEIKFIDSNNTEYTDGAETPTSAFGAVCPNVNATNFVGTVNVTYYDDINDAIKNHPKIEVTPDANANLSNTDLVLGSNFSTLTTTGTPKYLGTEATNPTYDTESSPGVGTYTSVLPQVNNTGNLKLKVNYKLYNTVTKEVIQITGKTAEIPANYLQWKANYKYTYLFKITDDNLNPITFDAVTVEAENGQAEYITTVSEPSITTFGVIVNSNNEFLAYQTDKNEYLVPSGGNKLDIYATIMDNHTVVTPTRGTNVKVYVAETNDATNFPITEASVANAIAHTTTTPISCTEITGDQNTYANYFSEAPAEATGGVLGEDGKWISIAVKSDEAPGDWGVGNKYYADKDCTDLLNPATVFDPEKTYYKKFTDALKLTGVKYPGNNNAYVIEYIYDTNKKAYKVIKVDKEDGD